jgi:hypothetical protein
MSRKKSGIQVLKKLEAVDFAHKITKRGLSMESRLDKLNPEVAKKTLEQVPEVAKVASQGLTEFNQNLSDCREQNAEETKSCFDTCDVLVGALLKEADKEDCSPADRRFCLQGAIDVAKMKFEKNSENKRFNGALIGAGIAAFTFAMCTLGTALGGSINLAPNSLKHMDK